MRLLNPQKQRRFVMQADIVYISMDGFKPETATIPEAEKAVSQAIEMFQAPQSESGDCQHPARTNATEILEPSPVGDRKGLQW